jgi:hypothetical protein
VVEASTAGGSSERGSDLCYPSSGVVVGTNPPCRASLGRESLAAVSAQSPFAQPIWRAVLNHRELCQVLHSLPPRACWGRGRRNGRATLVRQDSAPLHLKSLSVCRACLASIDRYWAVGRLLGREEGCSAGRGRLAWAVGARMRAGWSCRPSLFAAADFLPPSLSSVSSEAR